MQNKDPEKKTEPENPVADEDSRDPEDQQPKEIGGRGGLDPTRYGDWEKNGRCIDF